MQENEKVLDNTPYVCIKALENGVNVIGSYTGSKIQNFIIQKNLMQVKF